MQIRRIRAGQQARRRLPSRYARSWPRRAAPTSGCCCRTRPTCEAPPVGGTRLTGRRTSARPQSRMRPPARPNCAGCWAIARRASRRTGLSTPSGSPATPSCSAISRRGRRSPGWWLTSRSACPGPCPDASRRRSPVRSGTSPGSMPRGCGTSSGCAAKAWWSPTSTLACSTTIRRWRPATGAGGPAGWWTTTTTGSTRHGSVPPRRRATTTATVRTRWAPWSAARAATRSASPRARRGWRSRAASPAPARCRRCWPPVSGSWPPPTWPGATVKPNIAAPGVDVRSSVPGNGYASLSGTSMASPHTAAVVALMWSAAPALDGDIPATRRLLDQTAIDMDDTSCGGTAADNNVWGQGRLDAFAAIDASPWQATGALTGNVTDRGLFPLPDATVSVSGPIHRETITAADGQYRFHRLVPGTYTLTVTKFGFVTATRTVEVVANGTATAVVNLQRVPSARLSGTVYWHGQPAAGATVTIADTPLAVRSDAQGRYGLIVPLGQWEVRAELTDPCSGVAVQRATVTGDTVLDLSLPDRTDRYGYTCGPPVTAYVAGADRVELAGDDVTAPLPLPFPVPLYGVTYGTAWVSTNGVIGFTEPSTAFVNTTVPDPIPPNAALYPFWDDLYVDDEAGIYTTVTGEGAARRLTVEWRNVAFFADRNQRISFTATIEPDGTVTYRYRFVGGVPAVASATIALENADGTDAFTYSYGTPSLPDGSGVTFHPPRIAAGAAR